MSTKAERDELRRLTTKEQLISDGTTLQKTIDIAKVHSAVPGLLDYIDRLEEALKPFAKVWIGDQDGTARLPFEDCRTAHELLTEAGVSKHCGCDNHPVPDLLARIEELEKEGAKAKQAFDVMVQRGWTAVPFVMVQSGWTALDGHVKSWDVMHPDGSTEGGCWDDPFAALIEADKLVPRERGGET